MKQIVTDIQDIRAALDEEDAQLMRMFPRRREAALDEMLLVKNRKGQLWLVKKADVARRRKVLNGIILAVIGCVCTLYLIAAVLCAITGSGYVGVYLLLFELSLLPYIAKVPKEVRGGVQP